MKPGKLAFLAGEEYGCESVQCDRCGETIEAGEACYAHGKHLWCKGCETVDFPASIRPPATADMNSWAKRYDELNGAPESTDDR